MVRYLTPSGLGLATATALQYILYIRIYIYLQQVTSFADSYTLSSLSTMLRWVSCVQHSHRVMNIEILCSKVIRLQVLTATQPAQVDTMVPTPVLL